MDSLFLTIVTPYSITGHWAGIRTRFFSQTKTNQVIVADPTLRWVIDLGAWKRTAYSSGTFVRNLRPGGDFAPDCVGSWTPTLYFRSYCFGVTPKATTEPRCYTRHCM